MAAPPAMLRRRIVLATLASLVGMAETNEGAGPDELRLPARKLVVGRGLDRRLAQLLSARKRHALPVVIVVPEPLDSAARGALRDAGCRLLQALGPTSHLAALERHAALERLESLVVWLAPLEPVDHVDPSLWEGDVPPWARSAKGQVKVLVTFYDSVPADEAKAILERWASEAHVHGPSGEWAAAIDPVRVPKLASEEGVRWIEPGPDPMMPLGPA